MAFRNKAMTVPSIDDIIMQIMAMSEAIYDGEYTIGRVLYDENRPTGWPTAPYLLKIFGYPPTSEGWAALVDDHIGIECKTFKQIMQDNGKERANRKWRTMDKPDYTGAPDETYQALMSGNAFAICTATYQRTGRMMLR